MRFNEFKLMEVENASVPKNNLIGIKQEILDKIESLPTTKDGKRTLERVKDILSKNNTLDNLKGFISRIEGIAVSDEDVAKAVDQLAKLMGAVVQVTSVKDREFFFKLWESDRIVKVDKLMKGDKVYSVSDLFSFYGKSKAVTYAVNSLSRDAGYGLGKGELLLAVLSRRIKQAPSNKGDLEIDGLRIEVKTTDGGSPRFADQEVRVAHGYEQVRDSIYSKYSQQIKVLGGPAKSGFNLKKYIQIGQFDNINKNEFRNDTDKLLSKIFPDQNNRELLDSIVVGNFSLASRLFAEMSYTHYMNIKDDYAVLYIDLSKKEPTYVLFKSIDDLRKMDLTFKPSTIYILGSSGNRDVYPQMAIVQSSNANTGVEDLTKKPINIKSNNRETKLNQNIINNISSYNSLDNINDATENSIKTKLADLNNTQLQQIIDSNTKFWSDLATQEIQNREI